MHDEYNTLAEVDDILNYLLMMMDYNSRGEIIGNFLRINEEIFFQGNDQTETTSNLYDNNSTRNNMYMNNMINNNDEQNQINDFSNPMFVNQDNNPSNNNINSNSNSKNNEYFNQNLDNFSGQSDNNYFSNNIINKIKII